MSASIKTARAPARRSNPPSLVLACLDRRGDSRSSSGNSIIQDVSRLLKLQIDDIVTVAEPVVLVKSVYILSKEV